MYNHLSFEGKNKIYKIETKNDEKLFESIKNNIEDVSNTLPEVKKESSLTPVNNQNNEPKTDIIMPNNKNQIEQPTSTTDKIQNTNQEKQNTQLKITPAKQEYTAPIEHIKQEKPINFETPKNHVPRYDWNLKNIYLQKIGLSNLY